jgi:hypothetical protein
MIHVRFREIIASPTSPNPSDSLLTNIESLGHTNTAARHGSETTWNSAEATSNEDYADTRALESRTHENQP